MYSRAIILVSIFFLFFGCNSDSKKENKKPLSSEERIKNSVIENNANIDTAKLVPAYVASNSSEPPLEKPSSVYKESIAPNNEELRTQAELIRRLRKEKYTKPIAAIAAGKWVFDGENINGKFTDPKALNGKWIDFNDNWTYSYSDPSGGKGNGKYHLDPDNKLLLIIDNDKSKKPIEYKIIIQSDALVLMGQATYADGNYQAKCTRVQN